VDNGRRVGLGVRMSPCRRSEMIHLVVTCEEAEQRCRIGEQLDT